MNNINRDTVIDFLFGNLPEKDMLTVAENIEKDSELNQIYQEEKENLRIHLYVNDELQPFERIQFEYEMLKDEKLASNFQLRIDIDKAVECYELNKKLDSIYESTYKSNTIRMFAIRYKKWIAVASVILALIASSSIIFQSYHNTSIENRLYQSYYKPFDKSGKFVLSSSALNLAQQEYQKGKYKNAFLLFKELPVSLAIKNEKYFYLGLSLMELEQYTEALSNFDLIIESNESLEYLPQLQWYKGLCYLKTGEKQKAIISFKRVTKYNDCNYKKAKRILKKLS